MDFKLSKVYQQYFIKHAEQKNEIRENLLTWKKHDLPQNNLRGIN